MRAPQALLRRDTRRGLGQPGGNREELQAARQLADQGGAKRFEGSFVFRLTAAGRRVVRRQGGLERERMPLSDERAESARGSSERLDLRRFRHAQEIVSK